MKLLPLAVHATKGALSVMFTEPLETNSVKPDAFAFKVSAPERSANYGSKHYDEHPVAGLLAEIRGPLPARPQPEGGK